MNASNSPVPPCRLYPAIRFVLVPSLALGITFGALAQATPPPPSPFQSPVGPPPVTSTTANGQLGAAPVAPRAGDLAPPSPVDDKAARAAATRDEVPLPKSVEQGSSDADAARRARSNDNKDSSPAISPAGAGNSPAGTPMR